MPGASSKTRVVAACYPRRMVVEIEQIFGDLSANLTAGASLVANAAVRNRNNRRGAGLNYTPAREWFVAHGDRNIAIPHYEERFLADLAIVPLATGPVHWLRGRALRRAPQGSKAMGPPSRPSGQGRYNRFGSVVLYLADSIGGVLNEIKPNASQRLWIQEFRVPLQRLRVADFCALPDTEFLNHVFFNAERALPWPAPPDGHIDPPWAFSQRVAMLVEAAGFEGMLVRGAHADYRNLVIFRPRSDWKLWTFGHPKMASL